MKPSFRSVAVVGLGKSGFAAAKFLLERRVKVRVTDGSSKHEVLENASYLRSLGASTETGGRTESFLSGADLVVTSPGVPKDSIPLRWAKKKRIRVISEIELASYYCKGRMIAVTGSNGKTTTCHLIHRLLTDAGKKSVLCGNVGFSFLDAIPTIDAKTWVVLELSSFQLEDSPSFHPQIAVVLNVSPNHLDRHKTMASYVAAKERIFSNQTRRDTTILNAENPLTKKMAKKTGAHPILFATERGPAGYFWENGWIRVGNGKTEKGLFRTEGFSLQGRHNLSNLLAVTAVGATVGIAPARMKKTFEQFKTLPHRIELIGEIGGVRFVNDSKSTTVDSTRAAIEAMEGPIILLAGGRDKGAPFRELETLVERRARKVVLFGEAREKIAGAWTRLRGVRTEKDFAQAVRLAYEEARPGDTVLLSPMCTSFDQFSSYGERGETFKKIFSEIRARWTP